MNAMTAFARSHEIHAYTPLDLAGMSPLYAAYIVAHDLRVPKGRNDLFSDWIAKRRQEFLTDPAGFACGKEFSSWLSARHPVPQAVQPARAAAGR